MTHGARHVLRKASWLLFWLLALASLLIVLLFAYAVFPVLVANVRGGYAHIWFFGNTGYVVLAAMLYLLLAILVFVKKRFQGAGRRLGT